MISPPLSRSFKLNVSLVTLISLILAFGTILYRTPLKTITVLAPLFVLGALLIALPRKNRQFVPKIKPVALLFLIILMAILWIPITPIVGQNPASLYKDSVLVYTALNVVPFLFCAGTFVYSTAVYAKRDFKLVNFAILFLFFLVVVLIVFRVAVNKSTFVSYVNGNWFSMLLFQLYVIKLITQKHSSLSGKDVVLACALSIFTWFVLESRTICLAYILLILIYVFLTIFQNSKLMVAHLMTFGLLVSLVVTMVLAYFSSAFRDSSIFFSVGTKHGKNLLNGREYAWGYMWEQLQNHFWLGRGTGYLTVSESIGEELSAAVHNAWLDYGVKFGGLGIVLLFIFLRSYWRFLIRYLFDFRVRVVAALALTSIAFLTFYNMYGFSHFGLQLGIWFVLGAGLGRVLYLKMLYREEA